MKWLSISLFLVCLFAPTFGEESEQRFQTQFTVHFSEEIEKVPFNMDSLGNVLFKSHGLEVSSKAALSIEVSVDSLWVHEISKMAKGLIRLELKGKMTLLKQKNILSELNFSGKGLDSDYTKAFISALYSLRWDKDEMKLFIRQVKKNPGSKAL